MEAYSRSGGGRSHISTTGNNLDPLLRFVDSMAEANLLQPRPRSFSPPSQLTARQALSTRSLVVAQLRAPACGLGFGNRFAVDAAVAFGQFWGQAAG